MMVQLKSLEETDKEFPKCVEALGDPCKLLETHQKMSSLVITQDVKSMLNVLDQLEVVVEKLSENLPTSPSGIEEFLGSSNINHLSSITNNLPTLVSRLRRQYRRMATLSYDSTKTLGALKLAKSQMNQELLDYELQLNSLEEDVYHEQEAIETPKFNALFSLLQQRNEATGHVSQDKQNIQHDSSETVEKHKGGKMVQDSSEVSINSNTVAEADDVAMESCDPQSSETAEQHASFNESLEDFYLNQLKDHLACRTKESAEIESIKQLRQATEEKFKFFQKCEAELANKLNPVEKEMSKLAAVVSRTTASLTQTGSHRLLSPLVFPQKSYSLSPPLLTLFTKFFCYKAVSGDTGLELRLGFQPTTKPYDALFECDTGRLQVVIDKSATCMPPLTFTKAASVFPLSTRFSYFPKLNLVSAMCQFPRSIGSDVSFLTDLFFPGDDGSFSPNPLHHLATHPSDILPSNELKEWPQEDSTQKEQTHLSETIPISIAEHQAGRPYLWTQVLADMTFNVDSNCVSKLNIPIEKSSLITASHFVKKIRLRASYRTWNLYIEESLRENPPQLLPRGVVMPPNLEAIGTRTASMYQSFSTSTLSEFVAAGGSSEGKSQETRFLNGRLNVQGILFTVMVAVGSDERPSELCFHVQDVHRGVNDSQGDPGSLECFSFLKKILKNLPQTTDLEKQNCPNTLAKLSLESIHPTERVYLERVLAQRSELDGTQGGAADSITKPLCTDLSLNTFLGSLYPSSAHVMSNSESRPLTHFQEPSLIKLQESVNKTVPQGFVGEKSVYGCYALSIQLVFLAHHLDRWVRDVLYCGCIPTTPSANV